MKDVPNVNKNSLTFLKLFFVIGRVLPSFISVGVAERLFTTPVSTPRRLLEKQLLNKAEKFTINQDNLNEVFAYRWGNKVDPIVLFSHGWSSSGTGFIKFIEPLIAAGYQVVAYDAIAHGDTTGSTTASVTNWADTLQLIIEKVGEIHCIVGHSLGAGAIVVASSLKLKIQKIVLISPVIDIVKQTEFFAKDLLIPKKILNKMYQNTWDKYKSISSKYGNDWHSIFEPNIKVPTLIFHDVDDGEADIKDARKLFDHISKSRKSKNFKIEFIETNKLGHRRILLNPNVI